MSRLSRFTAACVGLLLLAAPAASACGELGAMASRCPMAKMGKMPGCAGASSCHGSGQMSDGCCDIGSAPEPVQAPASEIAKPLAALEVTELRAVAPRALPLSPPRSPTGDPCSLHDLGRYTLYSSFLL